MVDERTEYPEFPLRLPNGGPVARGRLLDAESAEGTQKFVVAAGSPVRADVVPSFATRKPTSYRTRQRLIREGAIRESSNPRGWLETTRDIECSSPSAAAQVVIGCNVNGLGVWKTADGRSLATHIGQAAAGSGRPWLVRGRTQPPAADQLPLHGGDPRLVHRRPRSGVGR
ncbi:DUF4357 domain-containing protein [Streptomyces sp. NPDC127033]|uniref:DUF4357 domain-containing protein n=1 Tax=Streptomyces sp. NPDC127033 TaxID=3347110 RepID=UPI00365BE4AC